MNKIKEGVVILEWSQTDGGLFCVRTSATQEWQGWTCGLINSFTVSVGLTDFKVLCILLVNCAQYISVPVDGNSVINPFANQAIGSSQ